MKYLAAATLLCLALVYHNHGEVISLKSEVMYFKERIEALLTVIEAICPDHVPDDYAHNRSKRDLPLFMQLLLEKEHYARLLSVFTTCHGPVRLNGTMTPAAGQTWIAGALEVNLDNRWGYVCDDIYKNLTGVGTVACRSLGGSLVEIRKSYLLPEDRFAMDDVECQGDEAGLTDCYQFITWDDNCRVDEGVFVNCTLSA